MKRPFLVLSLFCIALFAAILAGYWNMLDAEKLRVMREHASDAVGEVSAMVGTPATEPAPAASAEAAPAEQAAAPASAASAPPAPATPEAPAAAAETAPAAGTKPTFDILRVEPDGSAVMAGRAEPGAKVRLVDGGKSFGETTADGEGAFAIVLDRELPVGDHQIRIEGRASDGRTQMSDETAVVSIPGAGRKDQLLAMVESPDRPSRLIAVPAAEPAAVPAAPAAAEPAATPGETAAVPSAAATASAPAGAADPGAFAVEAVEIEAGTIYVAGRAPGRDAVRVYVDGNFVAEHARRDEGRFLVTSKVPVAPGDHLIRADLLRPDGTIASRVEVPFRRPEGETMAAIAAAPQAFGPAADALREGSSQGLDAASAKVPQGAAPATGEAPGAAAPTQTARTGTEGAPASSAAAPAEPSQPAATSASSAAASAEEPQMPTAPKMPAGPEATRQAALEGVDSRVIIRRGDTLWRISRDTYGRGARFTTIYLANGDQIRNPNRIYPGQVFRVPKEESAAD